MEKQTQKDLKSLHKSSKAKLRLRTKMALVILIAVFSAAAGSLLVSGVYMNMAVLKQYEERGQSVVRIAAQRLYPDEFEGYFKAMQQGKMPEGHYLESLADLREIQGACGGKYLYVLYAKADAIYYLFDTDPTTSAGQLSSTGYDDPTAPDKDKMLAGEPLPSKSSNGRYGYLYTTSDALLDSNGRTVAYICVDVPMEDVIQHLINFLKSVALVLGILTAVLLVVFLIITSKTIVEPILLLNLAASHLAEGMQKAQLTQTKPKDDPENDVKDHGEIFAGLNLRSTDEIGDLHKSLIQMERSSRLFFTEMISATSEKERIRTELSIANSIQEGMLPVMFPHFAEKAESDLFAYMNPAKEVGGDFYDFFYTDSRHLALVIADVSGKGVPGALFMMIGKSMIKNRMLQGGTPADVMFDINNQLCENNPNEMFITIWLGVIDLTTGEVCAVNAGHEYPMITGEDGQFRLFTDPHGFVCGGFPNMPYENYSFRLPKGGRIFVYTDGVAEATSVSDELFGMERIEESLNRHKDATMADLIHGVTEDLDAFVGEAEQFDDITMLSFQYKGWFS